MGGTFTISAPLFRKTFLTFSSASPQLAGGWPLSRSPILYCHTGELLANHNIPSAKTGRKKGNIPRQQNLGFRLNLRRRHSGPHARHYLARIIGQGLPESDLERLVASGARHVRNRITRNGSHAHVQQGLANVATERRIFELGQQHRILDQVFLDLRLDPDANGRGDAGANDGPDRLAEHEADDDADADDGAVGALGERPSGVFVVAGGFVHAGDDEADEGHAFKGLGEPAVAVKEAVAVLFELVRKIQKDRMPKGGGGNQLTA